MLEEDLHSEDLQDIIAKTPSWLLSRGISLIFVTIVMLVGATAFIRYPEIVTVDMKFTTPVSPKKIVNPIDGNLLSILVDDGTIVQQGQEVAFIESTADHLQVLSLLTALHKMRENDPKSIDLEKIISPSELKLGELQGSYQSFYMAYLNYLAAAEKGIYSTRKRSIQDEVEIIRQQDERSKQVLELQQKELDIAIEEYERYKTLAQKKIISPQELQEKEVVLLSKRQSIPQMESNLLMIQNSLLSKDRELAEINNHVFEALQKFTQAFNSFVSEAATWKRQHVLSAPIAGKLVYGGFLQENLYVKAGEELFYINPNLDEYYGEVFIPQINSSKIKVGQEVLIKVRSYPYQEYGYLHGNVSFISDIPIRDSVFFSKIAINRTAQDSIILLKPGIMADADIITEDLSIMKRIWMNLQKSIKY
ncbi:HlyD family secretion protein [Sphingobacterium bambusae]|uniref:HlyD family secretion protein n=2 Tax=Sphingobacterium bambusae TaxID=662858 RepID=A0ABW6BCA2_9SPHI|nr:HlyD family efflux transporter periplasmic adaptor subunit [Sphingobacterium bambusae]WPL49145.1 HlyD family efflux transporter periplasmic adaptor subunit [Sphingobacterium bambusae]